MFSKEWREGVQPEQAKKVVQKGGGGKKGGGSALTGESGQFSIRGLGITLHP